MIGNRRKNRRKSDERGRVTLPQINWRRWVTTAVSIAGVAGVCALVAWTVDQPIESVTVTGRFQRVAPTDVERAVKERVRGFGLVSVDLDEIQQSIESIPWVDSVTVQRAWPHGLTVNVVEQIAAARWRESGLLNTRGIRPPIFARR